MPTVAKLSEGHRVNVKISDAAFAYFNEQAKMRNLMPGALIGKFLEIIAIEPSYLANILDDGGKPTRVRSTRTRGYRYNRKDYPL